MTIYIFNINLIEKELDMAILLYLLYILLIMKNTFWLWLALAWILNTTPSIANNTEHCQNIDNTQYSKKTEIVDIKSKYKDLTNNLLICNENNQQNDYKYNWLDDLIVNIGNERQWKWIIKKIQLQKQKNFIQESLSKLNANYILNDHKNIKLITELYKIQIFISKDKTSLILKTLEKINQIINNNTLFINKNELNISFIGDIKAIADILGVTIPDLKIDSINQEIYRKLKLEKKQETLEKLKEKNNNSILEFQKKLTFMLVEIETDISNNKNHNLIKKKLQIFIDYHNWKKTYIDNYMNPFLIKKSASLISKLKQK